MKFQDGKAILAWSALCFGAALACFSPNHANGQVQIPPAPPLRLVTLAEALKDHGIDPAPPSLIAALKNSDPYVRSLAAHKLAEDHVVEAIPLIESALAAETNPRARIGFAGALAAFNDPKGVEQLQAICSDPRLPIAVNIESETYLQMAHLPIAVCADAILNSLSIESYASYRDSALYPLAGMYREVSPDQASRILAAIEALLKDPAQQPNVRLMASHALTQIGAPSSIEAFKAVIAREEDPSMKANLQSDLDILQKKQ